MYSMTTQQMSSFALLALFFTSTFAAPVVDDNTDASLVKIRENDFNLRTDVLNYWTDFNFRPIYDVIYQGETRVNSGDCVNFPRADIARSAKAPNGFKCTIYSDGGCHGRRTREFNQDGITDMGSKMNANGASWRCCKIGTTNAWGYCDGKLNAGS